MRSGTLATDAPRAVGGLGGEKFGDGRGGRGSECEVVEPAQLDRGRTGGEAGGVFGEAFDGVEGNRGVFRKDVRTGAVWTRLRGDSANYCS